MKKKQCKKCLIDEDLQEFHKDKYSKDGLVTICKKCRNAYKRQYNKNNKEKISSYNRSYNNNNKENKSIKDKIRYKKTRNDYLKKVSQNKELYSARNKASYRKHIYSRLITSAQKRAYKAGIEFTITVDDLEQSNYCPILQEEFVFGTQKIKPHPFSRTIDRLDNNLGYVPGNVLVVSSLANVVKNNSTIEELETLIKNLRHMAKYNEFSWKEIFIAEKMKNHVKSKTIASNLLQSCRRRAKIRSKKINISRTDLLVPTVCCLLEIPLKRGTGKVHANSPTIDRINNQMDYISNNILICSHKANRMKNQCSLEQLNKVVMGYRAFI